MTATTHEKLTELLKGKTISGTSDSGGEKAISFSDGTKLTVKVAPSHSNSASTGGAVAKVRESSEPPTLYLDLEGDSTVEINLTGAEESVTVHAEDGKVKYSE